MGMFLTKCQKASIQTYGTNFIETEYSKHTQNFVKPF